MQLRDREVAVRLGRNLRAYRKYRAFTQPMLVAAVRADGCSMSGKRITTIETGSALPTIPELIAIIRVLNCTYADIIGTDPKGNP